MLRRLLFLFTSAVLLLLAAPACGPGETGGAGGNTGTIVVGVTSDLRVGVDLGSIHVVMRAGGSVVSDEVLTASGSPALALPTELRFADLPGGTKVEVSLDAYRPGDTQTPLVNRLASTEVVADKTLLYRVSIDSQCVAAPGSSAPVCAAPETCVKGICRDEHVDASVLSPYTPDWSKASSDLCKPANAGPPEVIVGHGQGDYLPTADGDVAQVEAGPQGGHHIWVATRMKNLHKAGSITEVTGHFPDLNLDVGPFDVIFTFEPDEGGYCKLYGLRFQLDSNTDIQPLLGHPLDVKVTITDPDGDVGVGTKSVVLSNDFIE